MKSLLSLLLLFPALMLPALHADELAANTIKFSDPAKPGTLKIRISRGDVRVTGAEVAEITVKSEAQAPDHQTRKDGLRVLGASSSYSLTEKDNVVTLDNASGSWSGSQADFTITVPRATSVTLANTWGGDITCADLSGDVDIKSLNGEVKLDRLSGATCVETMNGEIHADIQTLAPGKTLSFTSMNGEVRVRVPADTKANIRLRTQNGSILTDFDEKVLITKLETIARKNSPRSTRTLGKKPDGSRSVPDSEMDAEIRDAVHEAVQAGAEVAREAALVARDAMRIAAEELRAHNVRGDGFSTTTPMAPLPPLPPMTGGKIISGTLNGGGPEIQIATMNGDVTLRKLDANK